MKATITEEGLWRIWRKEQSEVIEVVREQQYGSGGILSEEFLEWRKQGKDPASTENSVQV